jgi:pimeloyl-ACP methyl ester carboxylesterase
LQVDPHVLQWLDALRTPVWDWLTPVDVPMLMLSCEPNRGGVVQQDFVDALCAYMPHMTNVVIPNAAHEIHHDQPEAFMQAVLQFVRA